MSLNIKVKHSPSHYYGNDCFWIPSTSVSGWDTVMEWMQENGVEYTLNYVIEDGHRFTVSSKLEWFVLRWLC